MRAPETARRSHSAFHDLVSEVTLSSPPYTVGHATSSDSVFVRGDYTGLEFRETRIAGDGARWLLHLLSQF